MAQPLVPPLDFSRFDLSEPQPYFRNAFCDDFAAIDGVRTDLADIGKPLALIDVVAIAAELAKPLALADLMITDFDATDFTADTADLIKEAPAIDTAILNNETTAGLVGAAGAKIVIPSQPINGVQVPPATGFPPPAAPVLPGVGHGGSGPPLAGAKAFMTNINRPGDVGHFKVGDPWQITIQAPAGSRIYVVASRDGVSIGQSPFGVIPTSGVMLLHGTFTAEQIGYWIENWYAETHFINQIGFEVK